ncbi:DUF4139 domain-containing protein [Azospirillum sp. SYSU D00513]|uniref:DUF4139 domain-containing protein n=1 Tax=Azospirillum sp. SYSU D00513 TaxID=2812561 RepID=UPI001A95ED58|nr:DUF4139 domain-containing protein [Azospirillum sp. SYSU D00513]
MTRRPHALLAAALPLLLAGPALAAGEEGLALKRVMLSSGGVGYFEYEARVSGPAELSLEVRRDQVDDVLKSIVVYDDRGGVGTIALPGQEPLETAFRELPFTPGDLTSLPALLNALKGAELRAAGAREVTGRLLAVTEETEQLPNGGGTRTRHRVALMTAEGVRQLILEEADSLRFTDPAIQAQLDQALAAVAQGAAKERRRLTIRTAGTEPRTLRVAYVVAAPLWKSTYRLTLPQAGAASGDLQGWAVLENLSGEDWRDVELSVVSGNPVTFRQALYTAYFVNRPEVPVEVLGRVLPKPDEGAMEMVDGMAESRAGAAMAPPPAAAPAPAMIAPMAKLAAPAPQRPAAPMAAESAEATAQVLFRYPQPVTLANGGTLMMPVVARALPAERLALYQPGTHPRHPLAAVRLSNAAEGGNGGLPPGVLTLYESVGGAPAYVGDARLAALPAGESRLLSFAVDPAVTIDREEKPGGAITGASVANGVLRLTRIERQSTTYRIAAAGAEERTVLIEHPRRHGWTLVEPAGTPPEATADAYRLPVKVTGGRIAALAVVLERPEIDRIILTDLAPGQIEQYASATELPAAMREAMTRLAGLRATLSDAEGRVAALEQSQSELVGEQERLRENLGTLPQDSDLYKRTLDKMGEAETGLDGLARDIAAARREIEAARKTLAEQVRTMRF